MPQAMTCLLKDDEISFFLELIERAGQLTLTMRETVDIQEKTGPMDRVTSADLELSRILVEQISNKYPHDIVVSEEDSELAEVPMSGRVWMIDPIDGTDNYIKNDGQYSVMIGLLMDAKPVFGFVYAPAESASWFGGPEYGAWKKKDGEAAVQYEPLKELNPNDEMRLMMGFRDRKGHPWIETLPNVQLIKTGSIGVKVARILDNRADIFVHMSGKLKTWDTAGPAAIALANGLDVGTMDLDELKFEFPSVLHETSVVIGRKGTLEWCRHNLGSPPSARGSI
ncbi:MAG: inositol monophosphatase family protein [Candidatus Melainabacteria bacterium]|nr:inositol monophosphatase family protein [Candidatus Melainabacteria bacterium]